MALASAVPPRHADQSYRDATKPPAEAGGACRRLLGWRGTELHEGDQSEVDDGRFGC